MSQPYKRPCAETSTQFERDQARIIDELVRETQHMAVNPNNDVQTMELAGGLEAEVLPKDPAPKWPEHEVPNLDHYTAFQAYITQDRPLTPLTPLSDDDDPMDPASGPKIRHPAHGYMRPGEIRGLKPVFKRDDFRLEPNEGHTMFNKGYKKSINLIYQEIAADWVTPPLCTEHEIDEAKYGLITPYGFYHDHFRPALKWHYCRQVNGLSLDDCHSTGKISPSGQKLPNRTVGYDWETLWNKCEADDVNCNDPKTFRQQLLRGFLNLVTESESRSPGPTRTYTQISGVSATLSAAVQFAKEKASLIWAWRKVGQMAYDGAIWIPCKRVSKEDAKNLQWKFVVESPDILSLGLGTGAISKDEIVVPDSSWTRIVKPKRDGEMVSVILYEATGGVQTGAQIEEKHIFGAAIYNADHLTALASEVSQSQVHLEAQGIMEYLQNREALKRGFHYEGSMIKSGWGTAVTGGVAHTPQLPVREAGPNARESTKLKISEQTSLRVEIQKNKSLIQACNFALLEGFLPHLARKQFAVARDSKILNPLGFPDPSAFVSFAYGAPAHTDRDDTVTMGWISSRSDMIEDDESNFFYSDFKVILEMAENTHWIWDAATVFHGTTLGRLCAERPKSWKTCAKDNALRGQWSRANVVTHSQVTTARRMNKYIL